jgi:hypothetical protein
VLTSARAHRIRETQLIVQRLGRDLPLMLGRLVDLRAGGDGVPVSGGDRSDPTAGAATSAAHLTHQLDQDLIALFNQAAALDRLRISLLGPDEGTPSAPITDERGRLIRDPKGNPIEYCELHQHVDSNEIARRSIPHPSGSGTKMRVCRWCGDFYDETGRAPTTDEVERNVTGQRVKRPGVNAGA